MLEISVKIHRDLGHPACRHPLQFRWSAAEPCLSLALAHVGRCCWELVLCEGEKCLMLSSQSEIAWEQAARSPQARQS